MKTIIQIISIVLFIFSCRDSKTIKKESNFSLIPLTLKETETSRINNLDSSKVVFSLPDSLFKYKNLDNTLFIRTVSIESFTELDSIQKRILIKPFIKFFKDRLDYWDARFISKQESIGELQPIIIYILSTDYLAIWYMILNKNLNPISKLIIGSHGDYHKEYLALTDSTITYDSIKYCDLKNNIIVLHAISATMCRNKSNYFMGDSTKLSQIDSTNYIYEIQPDGSLYLSKKENFDYKRMFKIKETHEYWRKHF